MTPLNGKITKADAIERCAASKARLPTAAELNDARQDMVDAGYKNTRFWTQETGNPHTNKNRKTKLAVFYSDKELAKQAAEQAVRDAEKAKETLPQLICVR